MKTVKLDKYESGILKAFESGKLKVEPLSSTERKKYQNAARTTLQKNKNVNIRISELDLMNIKSKAIQKGLPYQTLLSSLIHQYSKGKIKLETL